MDASDIEIRDCELAYEHRYGHKLGYADIPEIEREVILKEIRARVLLIEQHVTHDMLVARIREQRRMPMRFMVPAFITALAMLILIAIGLGVLRLFSIR